MPPIRLGIIGLSATSSWAVSAHLPYLLTSKKYTITALLNSSVDSALAAIKAHSLPSTVAAHGSPSDLAADPNVDAVVCAVRVDRHYHTLLPSVQAGKDVYCEWPLGKNLAEAEELARAARASGSRTVVGLQAVPDPVVRKLRELIGGGAIGRVLSSTWAGAGYNGGPQLREDLWYLATREVGGNLLTIHFMHPFAAFTSVLGHPTSYSVLLATQRPTVQLIDKPITDPSRKILRTMTATGPDQIALQGRLASPAAAVFSFHLRGDVPFAPGRGLAWSIYGETGEICVSASSAMLQLSPEDVKIEMKTVGGGGQGEVQVVQVQRDEWSAYAPVVQNVARVYEAWADGRADEYYDWERAVVYHRLIEEIYQREEEGRMDTETGYAA